MKIKTNLSQFDPKVFDPVSPGSYETQVISVEKKQAATGTEFLSVEFEILGPLEKGRHVWASLYLTEAAMWKLAALLNAVGLPMADEFDTALLVGRKLMIRVRNSPDPDGDFRTEVVGFRRLQEPDATVSPAAIR